MSAPRVVKLAGDQVTLLNEIHAVLADELELGTIGVNVLPPAVYPVPVISLVVVYAKVELSKLANASYKAILYV